MARIPSKGFLAGVIGISTLATLAVAAEKQLRLDFEVCQFQKFVAIQIPKISGPLPPRAETWSIADERGGRWTMSAPTLVKRKVRDQVAETSIKCTYVDANGKTLYEAQTQLKSRWPEELTLVSVHPNLQGQDSSGAYQLGVRWGVKLLGMDPKSLKQIKTGAIVDPEVMVRLAELEKASPTAKRSELFARMMAPGEPLHHLTTAIEELGLEPDLARLDFDRRTFNPAKASVTVEELVTEYTISSRKAEIEVRIQRANLLPLTKIEIGEMLTIPVKLQNPAPNH